MSPSHAAPRQSTDFLIRADLKDVAPFVANLIRWEEERQARKLIMIPSESTAPKAVRQALGSVLQNVYAEGYPPLRMTRDPEERLRDVPWQLAFYRRYADRRFYKGVDYVHFVECLAQRRCAQLFAPANGVVRPEHIYVNVQPLSGAAANLAVYWALLEPGDTLMGLDLFQGGHLTHGSEFNISGQRYRVVSYGVNPRTERLDYDQIRDLARKHRPRIIVAGYTSYPWAPDWEQFRAIADEVGAYLMADISHTAGMAAAGVYPNPVGIADVTTFTTHKTICGPRGAVVLTTNEELAQLIDMAIFPGEQGGPHVNKFAALCVAFEIAQSEEFKQLQQQIVSNAQALARGLQKRGLRLAYNGTDTHLMLIDLKSIPPKNKFPVWGEPAVRILDLAGIVANKNTIPGDIETSLATGVRLGTPWVTQRGLDEADMDTLAGLIERIVTNIIPFAYNGLIGTLPRGKIELDVLEEVRHGVAALAEKAGIDFEYQPSGYPHYTFLPPHPTPKAVTLRITGWRARQFVQQIVTANIAPLAIGETLSTYILDRHGLLMDEVVVRREAPDEWGRDVYQLTPTATNAAQVTSWLRGLSDGYTLFDEEDIFRKVEGPVVVEEIDAKTQDTPQAETKAGTPAATLFQHHPERFDLTKPYFVGQSHLDALARTEGTKGTTEAKTTWDWKNPGAALKRTPLYDIHKALGAKMVPFAGWEMPVQYTSIFEEHLAVRRTAGLFDVAHMGVIEVAGEHATGFLDLVTSNYIRWIGDGQSQYSYLLDPDGNVIDDMFIYRRAADRYMLVVNAANAEKDLAWLRAVNSGEYLIDREHPDLEIEGPVVIRDLKDPSSEDDRRVDIALQGPASLAILQSLTDDPKLRKRLARLQRTEFIETELAGIEMLLARTGYTGEEIGYELYVHPDEAPRLWNLLLERGKPFGIKPTGLGARDSARTEAGLPLHGHDLAGPYNISPIEAGFGSYVKFHKPYFIGRKALLEKEATRRMELVRFRMNEKGVRMARLGDPVVDKRGRYIGRVTSCALGTDGFQVGLAYVERKYNRPGVQIGIIPLPARIPPAKPVEELDLGDKLLLQQWATVLTRFPEKQGRRGVEGPPQE